MLKILYFVALTYGISSFAKVSTPQELKERLINISKEFQDKDNDSIVFSSTYLIITNQFINAMGSGFFSDPHKVQEIICHFGNKYLKHLSTPSKEVVSPWRLSFNADKNKKIKLSTKLLLSMNAHINYDLPFSLSKKLKTRQEWKKFKSDYFKMNQIFKSSIPLLIENLKRLYDRNALNTFSLKEKIIYLMTKEWRLRAWANGFSLYLSGNSKRTRKFIEYQSYLQGKSILQFRGLIPKI